ncbi:Predicted nucleic acid-binding protein, contains PIN domain [Prosthecobacter debontii]|uniref:Predicted nucleic acid-binding protein, contains PIN domain n=1 Tax=Prosthecobacter debontii TaxID=48467 RepID=A0A1T4YI76_9BACT|nr:Predicted nucleic acid-binding protein, contains PIN domain [Prosthecobacter debontii]
MVYLDTNFLIDALVPGSSQEAQVLQWLTSGESLHVSTLVWGEFLCGPLSSAAEVLARSLFPMAEPLTRTDAEMAARLFNATGRRSKSFADCCIAAVAIRESAQLATSNRSDFLPMTGHGLSLA